MDRDAFNCRYVIDGVKMDTTPAQMILECFGIDRQARNPAVEGEIADETRDPEPGSVTFREEKAPEYLSKLPLCRRVFQCDWPESFSRQIVAEALIDAIWKSGHFTLQDLGMVALWEWDTETLGNMAAFYYSAGAVSNYLYDLGVQLIGYDFRDSRTAGCSLLCSCSAIPSIRDSREIKMDPRPKCSPTALPDDHSWIVYIPFDPCPFRLGGSLLEEACGSNGDVAPEVADPDYFIDSYEVVRELIEDGIAIAGCTVSKGGFLNAASQFFKDTGCEADISGIASSYQEKDKIRILFSEVPGVLLQIKDIDLDYLDSQLTLQDIAYYPIGKPDRFTDGVRLSRGRGSVSSILASLLSQASEGED